MSNDKMMGATPQMMEASFSWDDVSTIGLHIVQELETHGADALKVVRGLIKLVGFIAAKDLTGTLLQLNQEFVDVQALIDAVKNDFNL